MIEMHCVVTGNVQGVAYRVYAQDSAVGLDIVGSVKNLPDGTVFVIAQGAPDILKDYVEYLYEGSLMAQVEGVSIDWRSVSETFIEFSVLH